MHLIPHSRLMASKVDKVADVAERTILHFKDDPFERMRLLYNLELRPFQWEWWFLMDQYPDVLGYACMRVGKTFVVEIKNLDDQLMNSYEDCLIFAPKLDQAENSFNYQYQIIEKEGPIKSYVKRNAASKLEFGKNGVRFRNQSGTKCFGINSNFEGENATILRIEELDDIPDDQIKRVMGRGIAKNRNGMPTRHRLTGVIWGKLNIWKYKEDNDYYTLPPVDVYRALAGGLLDESAVRATRAEMSDDEWLRTMCLMFIESRNFIWSSWLHVSQYIGLKWNLFPVPPMEGAVYARRGNSVITFGLDMGAQGSGDDASEYSLQVIESIGPFRRWVYGITWASDTDPGIIINDTVNAWSFFRPNGAFSDARDANIAAHINEELYSKSLTIWDCHKLGPNKQEGWNAWFERGLMTPIHNTVRTKHTMYMSLRNGINNCVNIDKPGASGTMFIFPQVDRSKAQIPELKGWRELQLVVRELENLVAENLPSGS